MTFAVADRLEQRQFTPPFENVAEQHGADAERAEDETERAESLERREIRVFDLLIGAEPIDGGNRFDAEVGEAVFEGARHRIRSAALGLDEEQPIALVVRKETHEG